MIRCDKVSTGFRLPDYDIALDVSSAVASHCFVSHAHADHVPRSRRMKVFATPVTAKLMRIRGFSGEIEEVPFHQPIDLPQARVTLYPAGHILGSAMVYIETDDGNLLYTGDFRTPPSPTSDGFAYPESVDVLITEATFSLPLYKWKSHEALFDEIRQFATESLARNMIPVFNAYSLGKTQEILHALAPLGITSYVHKAGFPLCKVYEQHGINLGSYQKLDKTIINPGPVIIPSSANDSMLWTSDFPIRTAYVSGWVAAGRSWNTSQIDAGIALSDHVDFFDLIEWIRNIKPKITYVTHSPHPEVVCRFLTKSGLSAEPI